LGQRFVCVQFESGFLSRLELFARADEETLFFYGPSRLQYAAQVSAHVGKQTAATRVVKRPERPLLRLYVSFLCLAQYLRDVRLFN
jgi:hypothetical protein